MCEKEKERVCRCVRENLSMCHIAKINIIFLFAQFQSLKWKYYLHSCFPIEQWVLGATTIQYLT